MKVRASLGLLALVLVSGWADEIPIEPWQQAFFEKLRTETPHMPEVPLNTDRTSIQYSQIELKRLFNYVNEANGSEDGAYAFRFRTPKDPGNLYWAFASNVNRVMWYATPLKGAPEPVFKEFLYRTMPKDRAGAGIEAGQIVMVQKGTVRPDTEYIMWFSSPDDLKTVSLSFNYFPPDTKLAEVFPYPLPRRGP